MIGLIYKDILVMRKLLTYYLFFLLIYAVLVVAGAFSTSILPALVVVFAMMLPMSSVGYDDQANWGALAVATPAGRGGVVAGKYMFAVLCIVVSAAVVAALMALMGVLRLSAPSWSELYLTLLGCICVGLLINAVSLPLLLKFGSEKSRVISLALFAVIFGGVFLLSRVESLALVLAHPPVWLLNALPLMIGFITVGGFIISYFIARGIYEKKEF